MSDNDNLLLKKHSSEDLFRRGYGEIGITAELHSAIFGSNPNNSTSMPRSIMVMRWTLDPVIEVRFLSGQLVFTINAGVAQ